MSVPTGSDKPNQFTPYGDPIVSISGDLKSSTEASTKDITSFKTANINWTDAAKQAAAKANQALDIKEFGEVEFNDFSQYLKLQIGEGRVVWVKKEHALKLAEKILPGFTSQETNKLERLCVEIDKIAKGPSSGIVITPSASAAGDVKEAAGGSPRNVKELAANFGSQVTSAGSGAATVVSTPAAKAPTGTFTYSTFFEGWPKVADDLAKQKHVGVWVGVEKSWSGAAKEMAIKAGLVAKRPAIAPLSLEEFKKINLANLNKEYFTVKIGESAPLWFNKALLLELYASIFAAEPDQKLSENEKLQKICEHISNQAVHVPKKEGDLKQVSAKPVRLPLAQTQEIARASEELKNLEDATKKLLGEIIKNETLQTDEDSKTFDTLKTAISDYNSKFADNFLNPDTRNAQSLVNLDIFRQQLQILLNTEKFNPALRSQLETLVVKLDLEGANLQQFLELENQSKINAYLQKSTSSDIATKAENALLAYNTLLSKREFSSQIGHLSTSSQREEQLMEAENKKYSESIAKLLGGLTLTPDLEAKKQRLTKADKLEDAQFLGGFLRWDSTVEKELGSILSVLKAQAQISGNAQADADYQSIIKLFENDLKGREHLVNLKKEGNAFRFLFENVA